jgi:hypothetical protein
MDEIYNPCEHCKFGVENEYSWGIECINELECKIEVLSDRKSFYKYRYIDMNNEIQDYYMDIEKLINRIVEDQIYHGEIDREDIGILKDEIIKGLASRNKKND